MVAVMCYAGTAFSMVRAIVSTGTWSVIVTSVHNLPPYLFLYRYSITPTDNINLFSTIRTFQGIICKFGIFTAYYPKNITFKNENH